MSSANEIVTITLEISEYLDPTYFILEHPQMVLVKKHFLCMNYLSMILMVVNMRGPISKEPADGIPT